MDHVYLRAQTSIGLFKVRLQQHDLDCLLLGYEHRLSHHSRSHRGRRPLLGRRSIDPTALCETLSKIVNDKWNTRAWILQEAFASNKNMFLLFPQDNVHVRNWSLVCHEFSRSEVAIRLDAIQECFQYFTPFIRPIILKRIKTSQKGIPKTQMPQVSGDSKGGQGSDSLNSNDLQLTLKRLDFFHLNAQHEPWNFYAKNLKPRRNCNAAVALTYLRLRGLQRVADKLAILANICDYHVRLDTTEIEKSQTSLATCVLALSLVNNDFSLLVPQMYQSLDMTAPGKLSIA